MRNIVFLILCSCCFASLSSLTLQTSAQDHAGAMDDPIWRYTTENPQGDWQATAFDDSQWEQGGGGFGTHGTPGARIGTTWNKPDIWLRRTVELQEVPEKAALYANHDEDAEIYINGTQVLSLSGYINGYQVFPLPDEAKQTLRGGKNLIAVHCHQTTGGQAIDVHVIDADNVPKLPKPKRSTTPYKSEMITTWGEQVTPENAWREYPRPQLARDNWRNLNGQWDYAITPREQMEQPKNWAGTILVPFALESRLSGVQRILTEDESLWYHLSFDAEPTPGKRTLLNFEAVDYRCDVFVNDKQVGSHTGGNVPFSFEVTDALKSGQNSIVVRVDDNTEEYQLRGKQSINPHGIFYTQVSGIWQTVWLEEVSSTYIADLKISTVAARGEITVSPTIVGGDDKTTVHVEVKDGEQIVGTASGQSAQQFILADAKLWSPSSPHLYDLRITLRDAAGKLVDSVATYTGIRDVGKKRDSQGDLRFTLNGETIFHWGPLDQGWWPDGLLTPPSDEGMLFDIQFLKDSGFNMIRKHIKVEPRRYYYHCDRLGMMVWQDQVSAGKNPPWTRLAPNPKDADWDDTNHQQFMVEFKAMIGELESHPSIVMWTPFNEAWGQHRTTEVGKWMAKRDPSRLVNIASGGNFWPVGDVVDEHAYPHPNFPLDRRDEYKDFVKVVGEFGGHGLPSEGHLWSNETTNWGYGGLPKDKAEYKERYKESIRRLAELKSRGIAAGVYTQTTDVEGEINGLLSYDRQVIKIPAAELKQIHELLFQ